MNEGTRSVQGRTRTAILGCLAAVAAGNALKRPELVRWFEEHGIAIREFGLRAALALRLIRSGRAVSAELDPSETGWIRESIDFDATKLDLDLAVVVLPGSDRSHQLQAALRTTNRVVRIYRSYDRDLVAIIVYEGARERRRLQTLLEEQEPDLRWIVVRDVDDASAASSWLSLAKKAARQERLLTE